MVAKFDASNVKPRADSGNWQSVDSMPEFNDEVTGASDNAVAQKQIKSPSTQRATHLLGVGLSKDNAMEGLEVSRDTIKDALLERLELRCSEGAINMLQDFNFWKEAPNAHSSSHQAGKECSCSAACSACLMPDAVNIPILKSSLRLLETQRYVGSSKEAPDIPSIWHPTCIACFMPDAVNISLLDVWPKYFEPQKNYVQMLHGLLPSADQERQLHLASQPHALKSYFHEIPANSCYQASAASRIPEVAENLSEDINSWKEASNSDSSLHQGSKECCLYQACFARLMPDAVNIPLRKGSLRLIETRRKSDTGQQNITPNLHAVRAGATAAVDVNNITIRLGNSSGQAQKKPMKRMRAEDISSLLLVANIDTKHAEPTADIAGIQHSLGISPAQAEDALLPLQSLTTGTAEVAKRDREAMACLASGQGFLTLLRILTAAFQVSILGIDAWINIMKIHWALLVDHDGRLHCPQGQAMETRIMKTNRASSADHGGRPYCPHDILTPRYPNTASTAKAGKRAQWQLAEGMSTTPGTKAKIIGKTPTRASGGAKSPPGSR